MDKNDLEHKDNLGVIPEHHSQTASVIPDK